MSGWIAFALLWIVTGVWFVRSTTSRGVFADYVFSLAWPVHVVRDLLGCDR